MSDSRSRIAIVMGSHSDWAIMQEAAHILDNFALSYEQKIISAHRTPERLYKYAQDAQKRGLDLIIAGAGGAAHLPGMLASLTPLPVLGVPIRSKFLSGLDSLLSIAQMPKGVPVATLAINGAANAGLLAVRIIALSDDVIAERLSHWILEQTQSISDAPR